MKLSFCSNCGIEKTLDNCGVSSQGSKRYWRSHCKECESERRRNLYHSNEDIRRAQIEASSRYQYDHFHNDPEYRARVLKRAIENTKNRRQNDEFRLAYNAYMRERYHENMKDPIKREAHRLRSQRANRLRKKDDPRP